MSGLDPGGDQLSEVYAKDGVMMEPDPGLWNHNLSLSFPSG